MNNLDLLRLKCLILSSIMFIIGCFAASAQGNGASRSETYSCIPCGQSCDKDVYRAPGKCAHCQMPLVKTSTINFKTILPSEVCDYIVKNPQVVILDVRTKEEYEGDFKPNLGRLKNAINIPVQELESKLGLLSAYRGKQIIVYCSHSRRSPRASYILSQKGFKYVTNMAGGMSVMKDMDCKELK